MERFENTGQPDWDWWGRLWPTPGATLQKLGIGPGDAVAEVGCGNGYFALPAARITAPAPVYAVDLDETLLAELEALAGQQHVENVVPIQGDARELASVLPAAPDVVLLANAFHGIEEPAAFAREVATALAPDGRLVVVNWQDRPRETTTVAGEPRGPPTELRVGPDRTEAIVTGAGFEVVDRIDLPPYHYAIVFER